MSEFSSQAPAVAGLPFQIRLPTAATCLTRSPRKSALVPSTISLRYSRRLLGPSSSRPQASMVCSGSQTEHIHPRSLSAHSSVAQHQPVASLVRTKPLDSSLTLLLIFGIIKRDPSSTPCSGVCFRFVPRLQLPELRRLPQVHSVSISLLPFFNPAN